MVFGREAIPENLFLSTYRLVVEQEVLEIRDHETQLDFDLDWQTAAPVPVAGGVAAPVVVAQGELAALVFAVILPEVPQVVALDLGRWDLWCEQPAKAISKH